jgi:3-oxo-5-alpha-steroid 4-dehydrogenase 3
VAEFIVKGKKNSLQDLEFDWYEFISSLMRLGWLQWIGAAIFFWGWIHQQRCHDILVCLNATQRLCSSTNICDGVLLASTLLKKGKRFWCPYI